LRHIKRKTRREGREVAIIIGLVNMGRAWIRFVALLVPRSIDFKRRGEGYEGGRSKMLVDER
jgi:hypothetical protein